MRKMIRSAKRAAILNLQAGKHRLIRPTHHFIHIPKNGGTSVRAALGWRVSLTNPYHYRYVDIADRVGRDLKFFTVVRNPWSRTVSRYFFSQRTAADWNDDRRNYILSASFDTFVRERRVFDIPEHPGQPWMGPMTSWFNQVDWIKDESGAVVCDCLRLEHLGDDLLAYLGIRPAKRVNVTAKRDYRAMYTDETAAIVAQTFKEDIDYFGFTFDSAATRNVISSPD